MRIAVLALGLLLLPGVGARADVMTNVDLPAVPLPVVQDDSIAEDLTAPAADMVLPEGTGTAALVLSQQSTTAVTAEPSSVVLLASGLLALGGLAWRRRVTTRVVVEAAV